MPLFARSAYIHTLSELKHLSVSKVFEYRHTRYNLPNKNGNSVRVAHSSASAIAVHRYPACA